VNHDFVRRFLLDSSAVRGEIVSLDQSWRDVVSRQNLPDSALKVLGELSAAAVLLGATLKFDGSLILQIHGDGPIALMVVEIRSDGQLRATVKLREDRSIAQGDSLNELVNADGRGRFAVTLDPRVRSENRQPWQGIVPFEGTSVAQVLEHYMQRSEQLPTRLWLAADGKRAAGLLLQQLPSEGGRAVAQADPDAWNRMQKLSDTLTETELLDLPPDQILSRLFWQERLHGFKPRALQFGCSCSRDKVAGMLRMLGVAEVEDIISERGEVEVHCDFCNEPYTFDPVDCAGLFTTTAPSPAPQSRQ
jgi:molecular chaperone Hsp33